MPSPERARESGESGQTVSMNDAASSPVAENVSGDTTDGNGSQSIDGLFEGPQREEFGNDSSLPEDIRVEARKLSDAFIHDAILEASLIGEPWEDDEEEDEYGRVSTSTEEEGNELAVVDSVLDQTDSPSKPLNHNGEAAEVPSVDEEVEDEAAEGPLQEDPFLEDEPQTASTGSTGRETARGCEECAEAREQSESAAREEGCDSCEMRVLAGECEEWMEQGQMHKENEANIRWVLEQVQQRGGAGLSVDGLAMYGVVVAGLQRLLKRSREFHQRVGPARASKAMERVQQEKQGWRRVVLESLGDVTSAEGTNARRGPSWPLSRPPSDAHVAQPSQPSTRKLSLADVLDQQAGDAAPVHGDEHDAHRSGANTQANLDDENEIRVRNHVSLDGAGNEDMDTTAGNDRATHPVGRTRSDDDGDYLPALPKFNDGERRSPIGSPGSPGWDRETSPSSDGSRLPSVAGRRGSSRPLTSFIDAEVAEIVAARTQRQNQEPVQAETMSFEDPPKQRKPRATQLKPIKSRQKEPVIGPDGKFERVWLTPDEVEQLEREAAALRKELQELDAERARRRKAAVPKRSATHVGFSRPDRGRKAGNGLPTMQRIGARTYVHAVARRQDNYVPAAHSREDPPTRAEPEEEVADRAAATAPADGNEAGSEHGGGVSLFFEAQDALFEAHEAGDALGGSAPSAMGGGVAAGDRAAELSGPSLRLLERTPLSQFNRHWNASKACDMLLEYLTKEVQGACESRGAFEGELRARRERRAKEEQRQSELDTQKAIRAYKRAERQFTMRADLLTQTAEFQERLAMAEGHAFEAKDAYHTLHERLKWKDSLSLKEEADLGRRRQEMDSAEQQLEAEAIEFELRLHRAFVEKAKTEQEKLRGQKARRQATIHEQVLKAEDMDFFFGGGDSPAADALFATNRLRAAAVQHAQRHGKDFVVALYQCAVALEALAQDTAEASAASFGVGDAVEYAGQWGGGCAEGLGVETARGGVVYEGQWKEGRRHGLGALEHTKLRVIYEGTWWEGLRHGYGVELHVLASDADQLPVAFVEYEHGQRVGCKRFDGGRAVEPLMLESVRRVREQARRAAAEGRGARRVQVSHEEGDESGDEGKEKTPRKEEVSKSLLRKRKERRRRDAKRQEQDAKRQDLAAQKRELEGIEGGVEAALNGLRKAADETLSAMSASLGKCGLKSGRLYSMTQLERSHERQVVQRPSEHNMRHFLQKKGVPDVLADRIVSVYFTQFQDQEHLEVVDDAVSAERALLFDVSAANGAAWQTYDAEKRLTSVRRRKHDADRHMHHARDKMKAAFSLPGVAKAALSLPVNAGGGRRRAPSMVAMAGDELPRLQPAVSKEQEIQDAMRRLMNGNENEPVVITVPVDMPLEAAVQAYTKSKYDYILVRPGAYRCSAPIEVTKELHVVGELGAKVVASWVFKAMDTTSTFHNITLQYDADERQTDYERLLHVSSGEVHLTDSALLCPRGYCLWTSVRATVSAKGCIFAGSEDGSVRAAAGAVAMDFSHCTVADSRMENLEEAAVFADNDADARLTNCVMQCADIGIMLTDRARATLNKCTLRVLRRGCFGQMRPSETELHLKDSTTHGKLWGLGDKPARFIKFGNKHLEEFQPPAP